MSWRSRPDGDLPAIIRESARTTRGRLSGRRDPVGLSCGKTSTSRESGASACTSKERRDGTWHSTGGGGG